MTNEHANSVQQGVWTYLQANAYARSRGPGMRAPTRDTTRALTIAISREAGIDAGAYARAIGQQLGWPVWDHELLERIARRLGSQVSDLEPLDERHISWLQESMEAFLALHAVNQHAFVRGLRETVEELAELGNCIIVGRGVPHLLPAKTTLKIRLVAPLEHRVIQFQKRMGMADAAQVARMLDKIDRERIRFVRDHFHQDAVDPAGYDVILNTSHFSPTDCAPGARFRGSNRATAGGSIGRNSFPERPPAHPGRSTRLAWGRPVGIMESSSRSPGSAVRDRLRCIPSPLSVSRQDHHANQRLSPLALRLVVVALGRAAIRLRATTKSRPRIPCHSPRSKTSCSATRMGSP